MLKYTLLFLTSILITANVSSQSDKIGYGFRAGPSYSTVNGPSEIGPNGETLETFSNTRGFHIGGAVSYKITDLMGLRGEFMFSQRGMQYTYDGPSYYVLGRNNVQTITIDGERHQNVKVSNAFLDIPILFYYKLGGFEFIGGFNTGLLIASTGGGTTTFNGTSALGTTVAPFNVTLDHNYKTDKAGEASEELQDVMVDGKHYGVPSTVGAYYEYETKDKNLYETLDFGLVFGLSFYLNEGLSIGGRYVYGLGDVDDNFYDVSLQSLNNGSTIPRADKNESRSFQLSIGFNF